MHAPAFCITTVVTLGGPRQRVDNAPGRVLSDMLDDCLQGLRSVREAAATYGAQSNGAGRPRKFRTFAEYLRDRIAYAESRATENELRRLLFASVSGHGTSQSRSAMTVRVNRMLDETGKDRADRLRELLTDLTEPVRGNA